MNKRERFFAAAAGEDVDHPPCCAWLHFGSDCLPGEEAAERHIAFQRAYDWDICKVMHDYRYPFPADMDTLESPRDMDRVENVAPASRNFAEQLKLMRAVRREFGAAAPIVDTLFDPVQQVVRRAGYRKAELIYAHPREALPMLDRVTESLCAYVSALREAGCDGAHYAIIGAIAPGGDRGIDDETFRTFLRPFDLRVLEAMQGMVRIVHVHGTHVDMRRVLDYPCEVFSVSDRLPGNPSLAELRAMTDKCLMGGVNEARIHEYPLPVLRAEMRDALRQAGRRGFMLAPGCTVASHTAEHILRCLRDTSRQLTGGRDEGA
ncbi:MAG: hypothetical protein IT529_01825 [Burkholderiales bacterium]|nr:hypothetical protein [Burkholderiales bacterium]